jgi:hypothetical protein
MKGNENMEQIKEYLLSVLRKKIPLNDFEQWLYDNEDYLEAIWGKETYFTFINLNYRSKYVMDELEKYLIKILNFQSYEEFRIIDLLNRLVYLDEEFISSCSQIYLDYCNGYSFFRMLALKYIVFDYDDQLRNPDNREDFLRQYKEEFIEEGKRLLRFIEGGDIKIIGENEYTDNRDENQKKEERYWT